MFSKILVPLDGSSLSEKALDPAVEMASKNDSEIILLEAVQDSLAAVPEARYHVPPKEVYRSAVMSMQYLRSIATPLRMKGIRVRCHVQEGDPCSSILSYAHREDVDVIVMSTHGRSGLSRMVMGSVASKVATTTHRPVVLVKAHQFTVQEHERAA
jgi:nucleotide-binding universal stress UspA family protein